jgi:WD40 repeat protein
VSIAFSPDGQRIASGSEDQTIKLWDIGTGQCLHTLSELTDWAYSVAFSPDGQRIASGSRDGTIEFWEVETREHLRTLRAPKPYEGMSITGIKGVTEAQKTALKALGAIEDRV